VILDKEVWGRHCILLLKLHGMDITGRDYEEMLLGKVGKGMVPIRYFGTRGALFPAVYQ
jgi:hypothetical protein